MRRRLKAILVHVLQILRRLRKQVNPNRSLPMIVATEQLHPGDFDRLLGTWAEISQVGLFKGNRSIRHWMYDAEGRLVHTSTRRINNVGLFSPKDYVLEREEGEYRICILGDEQTSSTLDEVSWPDFLEEILNADADLLSTLRLKKFKVFNYAWPDAGFPIWKNVYFEKIKPLNPDLVILNFVAHSFERLIHGKPATLGGRQVTGHAVEYRVGENNSDTAYLWVACSGSIEQSGPPSLRNPNCICGETFQLYLPSSFGDNSAKMMQLRKLLVQDLDSVSTSKRVKLVSPPPDAVDRQRLVDEALGYLNAIQESTASFLITRNFWRSDVFPVCYVDEMSALLLKMAPHLGIVCMQDRLQKGLTNQELASWYLPHDTSKWSEKGRKAYASLIAGLVKERLGVSRNLFVEAK